MALTMVLGYDGSDCARRALGRVADLVRAAGGARVVVVNAYEFSIGYVPMGMTDSPLLMSAEYGQHIDLLRERGDAVVDEAAAALQEAGAAVERVVVDGSPVEALLAAAKDSGADLIVVGSHGEGAMSAAFLGSTAMKLLHHSEVPVLVVPRHKH
jgi:nucleotide-binding universal stress UspA family protein